MILSTFTMSDLIDEVLQNLYRVTEQPFEVALGSNNLSSVGDTSLTLATADDWNSVNVGDILEFSSELVRVTAKTEDPTPVFTVRRSYDGTTAVVHAAGTIGAVNPNFPRHRLLPIVKRALYRLDAWIPLVVTEIKLRTAGLQNVVLGADVRDVVRVMYHDTRTGLVDEVASWQFYDDLATADFTDGKVLTLPRWIADDTELHVTQVKPYTWSPNPPTEASTVSLPHGSEGVVISYAAAYAASRREIGRLELDRTDEWSKVESARVQTPMSVIRELWQQLYRDLDEAKRLNTAPKRRPYRPRKRAHSRAY